MTDVKGAIHRVVLSTPSGQEFSGTSVAISRRHLLTACHVVDVKPYKTINVERMAAEGQISGLTWDCLAQHDAALGTMPPAAPDRGTWLCPAPTMLDEIKGPLTAYGFTSDQHGCDKWTDEISGFDHQLGLIVLQNSVRPGVSGGPVIDALGRFVAIMVARHRDASQKYALPILSIFANLEQTGWRPDPIDPSPHGESGLLSVSIGPVMTPAEIPGGVIDAFATALNDRAAAHGLVARAMTLRSACNPENFPAKSIVISVGEYPAFTQPIHFWFDIFSLAGMKSRRTVAALLLLDEAPDPRFLESGQARDLNLLRSKLGLPILD